MSLLFEKYVPWYIKFISKIRLNVILVLLDLVKKVAFNEKKSYVLYLLVL